MSRDSRLPSTIDDCPATRTRSKLPVLSPSTTGAASRWSRGSLTTLAMAAISGSPLSLTSAVSAVPVATLTSVAGSVASSGSFELVAGGASGATKPEEAAAGSLAAVLRRAGLFNPADFAEFGGDPSTGDAADRSLDLERVGPSAEGGPVSGGSGALTSREVAGASLDDRSEEGAVVPREEQLVLIR